ncbi:unnamed protein product [Arabidopsis lyrata]|nr:unnamed protein product [Arabidopsis lyrata]
MYKNAKKKIERGVAFPSCISVIHFSPLASDESVLEDGDMVKICLESCNLLEDACRISLLLREDGRMMTQSGRLQ